VAIAWSWVGEERVEAVTLRGEGYAQDRIISYLMLSQFRKAYDRADMVTGHYIKPFDLPIINGALLEHGLPLLGPKLACDTHKDFVRVAGLSKSQENLSLMLKTGSKKFHMADNDWRRVARLEPEAMGMCLKRVTGDVVQHKEDRLALHAAGALKPPRAWQPG
jgi:hypothetical protein